MGADLITAITPWPRVPRGDGSYRYVEASPELVQLLTSKAQKAVDGINSELAEGNYGYYCEDAVQTDEDLAEWKEAFLADIRNSIEGYFNPGSWGTRDSTTLHLDGNYYLLRADMSWGDLPDGFQAIWFLEDMNITNLTMVEVSDYDLSFFPEKGAVV